MSDQITLSVSDFAAAFTELDHCTSLLPGQEPIPGTILPDCTLWHSIFPAILRVTENAIDRMLGQQRLGDALGDDGSAAALAMNRSEVESLIDDVCGASTKWPLAPHVARWPLADASLPGSALFRVGAKFQAAAERLDGSTLEPEFKAAAERLFAAGLQRLANRANDAAGATAAPTQHVCEMMAETISLIIQEIAQKERRSARLLELIQMQQGAPQPDLALIAGLQDEVRALQTEMESNRSQLTVLQEEFSASCT